MKKILFFIISFLFYLNSFSQFEKFKSPFENGFSTGFKEGYCYGNQNVDCFTPTVPLTPLPNINERKDNFRDGYNRGFQLGLDLKRIATGGGTTSPSGISYSSVPNYKFNDYIPQVPVDAYANAALNRQRIYDANVKWVQERMDDVYELNVTLLSQLSPNYSNAISKGIRDFIKSAQSSDFSLPSVVNQIKAMLSEKERQIYQEYKRSIEEANSVVVDLKENISNNKSQLITRRIRPSIENAHVFYLQNNLKDTLPDNSYTFSGILTQNNNGIILLYLKANKSYYTINPQEYYNQNMNTTVDLKYLSTNNAIAVFGEALSIIDGGNVVDVSYLYDDIKTYKTIDGDYQQFIVLKNSISDKRYFIQNEIYKNYTVYKPYPIFSK